MSSPTPQAAPQSSLHQTIHNEIVRWLKTERGIDIPSIDYGDSLLNLGIDSMGLAVLSSELERVTGKQLNPEHLFDLESINDLVSYLESAPSRRCDDQQPSKLETDRQPTEVVSLANPTESPLAHYERLNRRVETLKQVGRYYFETEIDEHDGAWVTVQGQRMLMLGSYEYLGLLDHPRLKQAAIDSLQRFGTGHHGARLLTGTTAIHKQLETRLASFMQADDAIVFSSGYVTNLATISALVGRGDCVIGDQVNHASIVDGCRMSGARFLEFRHNDMDSLAQRLEEASPQRTLVVVDSVFSMDGDIVDLPAVVDLARKHNALIMVDEAHSLGVLGATGRGVQEHFNLDPGDIDIKMGTLSKSLAASGGFVAGSEAIVTYLRHHARGYIFSGALSAASAAASVAALEVLTEEPEIVERLRRNVARYTAGLQQCGFDTGGSTTPIVPVMTKTDPVTIEMTRLCREAGVFVVPVCFPAVPADAPRLRTCVSSAHSDDDIDLAIHVLEGAGREVGLID